MIRYRSRTFLMKQQLSLFVFLFCNLFNYAQNTLAEDRDALYLPFKGGVLYDSRSTNEKLADIRNGEEPATNLNIKFSDFFVTIYDYGVYETVVAYDQNNKPIYLNDDYDKRSINLQTDGLNKCYLIPSNDTVLLNEWVFNDLSDKILKITPLDNDSLLHFRLSAQLNERIWQQYPRDMDFDKWEKLSDKWEGLSPSITIKDSANYFFSNTSNSIYERFRQLV